MERAKGLVGHGNRKADSRKFGTAPKLGASENPNELGNQQAAIDNKPIGHKNKQFGIRHEKIKERKRWPLERNRET